MRGMKLTGLFWLAVAQCALTAPLVNLPKPVSEARFQLLAAPGTGELKDAEVLSPFGRCEALDWANPTNKGRGLQARFPVNHYSWTQFGLQFIPASNGMVTIKLTSEAEAPAGGTPPRQDLMWDDINATGMVITNGSFENYIGNRPVGWEGGGVANIGVAPAFKEFNYGRTWLDHTLMQSFPVTAGQPVAIWLAARAVPPFGRDALRPITDKNTLAHQAAAYYRRGANAGNFLEVPPGQTWSVAHTEEDFRQMKAEGFDHVRIPVGWHHYTGPGPEFTIAPEFLTRVDTVVSNALKQGLFVIVNLHHFDAFTTNPAAHSNQFFAIWRQLAQHYARAHPGLALELLNEPKDAATTQVMNPIYAQALKIIRGQNPMRTVFLGPGKWNSIEELGQLWLPPDEDNVIVTVHCYEPFYFTHQTATWAGPEVQNLKGIVYPGPPPRPLEIAAAANPKLQEWLQRYNTRPSERNPVSQAVIAARLKQASAWSDYYGRPVHLGEFGCYSAAADASRARYYADVRKLAETLNLGWAMWDWKAGFKYWDAEKKQPAPGLREALFSGKK
jgi:endoglucanase